MAWSLIRDTLEFAKRHLLILVILVLPIQFVLATLFEVSGVETVMIQSLEQLNDESAQNADMASGDKVNGDKVNGDKVNGDEGDNSAQSSDLKGTALSERDQTADLASDELEPKMDELPPPNYMSTLTLFVLYLVLSVVPTALVILYVQAVFAARSPTTAQIYSTVLPLVIAMIGLYAMVWGALFGFFMIVFTALSAVGGQGGEGTSLFMTLYFGVCVYVHHRLSLAPYIWVNERISLRMALQRSWVEAKPAVFVLIFGNCLLYVGTLLIISMFVSVLQGILPDELSLVVRLLSSVVAGIGSVVMTIFVYRVYAFLQDHRQMSKEP